MSKAFDAIADFYGDRRTRRSGVPLMNHITEGLIVLHHLGAGRAVQDAFCLHPLFQADDDLVANLPRVGEFSPYVMTLVMEYRARANEALSDRVVLQRDTPVWVGKSATPGSLAEVQLMLIADKVQNYADFLLHHVGTHPRSAELDFYFKHWLQALRITNSGYSYLVSRMKA